VSGWGASSWGGSPWGAGAPFDLVSADALTAQSIRCRFTIPPRAEGDRALSDVLTRSLWTLAIVSSDTLGTTPSPPSIIAIEVVDATAVDLRLAGELESGAVTYRVDVAPTLRSAGGAAVGIRTRTFRGVTTARTHRGGDTAATRAVHPGLTDRRNNATPHSPAGTWKVTSEGDYDLTEGAETLRKLQLRRLLTPRGGFAWLPSYGFGITRGRLINVRRLPELEDEARRQLLMEPEAEDVGVSMSFTPALGILRVRARTRLRSGGDPVLAEADFAVGGAP